MKKLKNRFLKLPRSTRALLEQVSGPWWGSRIAADSFQISRNALTLSVVPSAPRALGMHVCALFLAFLLFLFVFSVSVFARVSSLGHSGSLGRHHSARFDVSWLCAVRKKRVCMARNVLMRIRSDSVGGLRFGAWVHLALGRRKAPKERRINIACRAGC